MIEELLMKEKIMALRSPDGRGLSCDDGTL
jgi:hypothetical protein